MEHGKEVTLCLRQFDAGTVAAPESWFTDSHLLAFETGRDAADEDDGLGVANLCQKFLGSGVGAILDVEVQGTIILLLHKIYLDAIRFTALYFQFLPTALDTLAGVPDVHEGVAVNDQAQSVVAADVEYQCLVLFRC